MTTTPNLTVREISPAEHLAAISVRGSVSFLQTPAWGKVKSDWKAESIGWFEGDTIVGVALVLYRQAPRIRRYLAYLPEGPDIDWDAVAKAGELDRWLSPLVDHVKKQRAFGLRIGPTVPSRLWQGATIKQGLADPAIQRLTDLAPDESFATGTAVKEQLAAAGWRPQAAEDGFGVGQPRHVFQLPVAGRTEEDVLRGFNQLWRRNIKKAAKSGVTVTTGGAVDLPAFHELYSETADRDEFTPRPLPYFEGMWKHMTDEDPDRIRLYLAHHEGDLVAARSEEVV